MQDNFNLQATKYSIKNPLDDILKNGVPSNVRMLVKSLLNPGNVNENNFSQSELDVLRDAYRNRTMRGDVMDLQYDDYPRKKDYTNPYGELSQIVSGTLTDKGYQLANTLGRADYYKDNNNNVHIKDTYDFPKVSHDYKIAGDWNALYRYLHSVGEDYSKSMPIDINLGRI